MISPIELARSQDWGRGRGGDLGLVKLKFEAFACQDMGRLEIGKLGTYLLAPFLLLAQPFLLPVQEGTNPSTTVSLANPPHLVHRFFPDPRPLELLGQ